MKHYYYKLACFGLLMELIVVQLIMEKAFWQMLDPQHGAASASIVILTIVAGVMSTLIAAKYFDRTDRSSKLYQLMIGPLTIFLTGVVVGSFMNFMLFAVTEMVRRPQAVTGMFFDYFIKPVFWLAWVGIPASLVVGLIFWAATTAWKQSRSA